MKRIKERCLEQKIMKNDSSTKIINLKREENQKKAEVEKEIKSLESCTFYPNINKHEKLIEQINGPDILHKVSFLEYVDKQKKFRESNKQAEIKLENKVGTGKNWKKKVTVPDKFSLSEKSKSSRKYNNFIKESEEQKINSDLKVNIS